MAKGYGTILVILAHIGSGIGRLWIYTFHMPLFFFLSGYVFSTKYEFREFLGKNTMLYYAWHQTIMMPVVEDLMEVCGITRLVEKGGVCYNLVWLLGILLITTVLIWVIKKLGLKFVLGR